MSVRNLQFLFEPRSVAVIGATENARHIGAIVLRNLIAGGFRGSILPVNPKYDTIAGLKNYRRIADLPQVPELALICTPARTVAAIVGELGAIGTKAVIVHSGMVEIAGGQHGSLTLRMLHAAAPYLLRILGPDSVGLQVPQIGLNASFAPASALPGSIAFVSQSGALANVVLDWAGSRGIGFSRFVTLGQCADIDVADVLDYLARDACTKSILLYVEQIGHARKFMSAARAAARSKPTLVVRAGGRSAGDDVYDAAIRRAGMLRLQSTEELFGAVETLAWARSAQGERLSIVTNGGGLGAMAAHALVAAGGSLVALSDETQARLQQALPAGWSGDNPLDIADNAAAESYVEVMRVLLQEPESDAILFIHAPSALVASADIARAIVPLAQQTSRNILTCWPGGALAEPARRIFAQAGIPSYATPEEAVQGFMHIAQYRRNQNLLMQVPSSMPAAFEADRILAQDLVQSVLADGRTVLSGPEANAVLAAYRIAVVDTHGAPAGGGNPPMLRISVAVDPVFGPAIRLCQNTSNTEFAGDGVVGLPPLNTILAQDMVAHVRMFKLQGSAQNPPADDDALCHTLVQVSHLIADLPQIVGLDISPLSADSRGMLVGDVRMQIAAPAADGDALARFAIRPYPDELEQTVEWQGQKLLLRPIKPEDGPAHVAFFSALEPQDVRYRMFVSMRELQPSQLARLTQIDYDREMAFVAVRQLENGESETLGVARAVADPDDMQTEFAVVVRSDLKGTGLGMMLMRKLIDYCRRRGIREMVGETMPDNAPLLNMATRLGFTVKPQPADGVMKLRLPLNPRSARD